MKTSPEETVSPDNVNADVAVGERGAAVDGPGDVIVIYSSAESEDDEVAAVWSKKKHRGQLEDGEDEGDGERRGRSKKKRKKHHHHKHSHRSPHVRKTHKKRKKQVSPIFLWAQKRETEIVKVVCEDYDPHNRLRLVKTDGVWTSNPRSKVLAAAQSRSTVSKNENESQRGTDEESAKELEKRPEEKPEEKPAESEQIFAVDLNDNSIDFVDTIYSEEDDEEQRDQIAHALEMINQDPTLLEDVKITLPDIETGAIKLPEGTTIHQVKTEDTNKRLVTTISPLSPPLSPANNTVAQCTYGELTITPQQQLQNEPLNLETAGKRSALEIRLQEPPLKKKKRVVLREPRPALVEESVKQEWDALAELKEVLSNPSLSVPDPLLVPRGRLAALVASPATEIPKLLLSSSGLPPPPDLELFAVSLSHLRAILQQTPGFADERKGADSSPQLSTEHMLWRSYVSSKEIIGIDNELISCVLSLINEEAVAQQSYNYSQQKNQWNDVYYASNLAPPPYNTTPGYSTTDEYGCTSAPQPVQQQPSPRLLPKHQQTPRALQSLQPQLQQTPQMQQRTLLRPPPPPPLPPPVAVQPIKQRVCTDPYCNSSPSPCYQNCCPKPTGGACNPYTVIPPNGCNTYAVSPVRCGGTVIKSSCRTYPADGTACCYPPDVGCGYNGQPSAAPVPPKVSVSPRNHGQYSYQTGLTQPQSLSAECSRSSRSNGSSSSSSSSSSSGSSSSSRSSSTSRGYGGGVGNVGGVGNGGAYQPQCSSTATDKPQTSRSEARLAGDVAAKPLHKPKIKVKQHLIDPNAKPRLLNIEGALHLAGANPQDLFTSPLWHPLFGSQEKRYGCRWQWTTPVTTTPAASTSSDTSGRH